MKKTSRSDHLAAIRDAFTSAPPVDATGMTADIEDGLVVIRRADGAFVAAMNEDDWRELQQARPASASPRWPLAPARAHGYSSGGSAETGGEAPTTRAHVRHGSTT